MKYREPVDPRELLAGLTLEKLHSIYQSILKKQEDKIDPIRSRFGTIEKEEVSLSEKDAGDEGICRRPQEIQLPAASCRSEIKSAADRNISVNSGAYENGIYSCGTGCIV